MSAAEEREIREIVQRLRRLQPTRRNKTKRKKIDGYLASIPPRNQGGIDPSSHPRLATSKGNRRPQRTDPWSTLLVKSRPYKRRKPWAILFRSIPEKAEFSPCQSARKPWQNFSVEKLSYCDNFVETWFSLTS